ncbi:MAG: TolC family protein [Myxococcota bacterium]
MIPYILTCLTSQATLFGGTGTSTPAVIEVRAMARRQGDLPELPPVDELGDPLKLQDVLRSVRDAHPALIESMFVARAAAGKALSARGHFDPRLKLDANSTAIGYYDLTTYNLEVRQNTPLWGAEFYAGYRLGREGDEDISPYDEEIETLDDGEFRVGLVLPIYRNGPIDAGRAEIRQTRAAQREAEAGVRVQRLTLALQAVAAYWTWVSSEQKYRVLYELAQIARLRDQAVKRRIDEGTFAELERAESMRAILDRENEAWKMWQKTREAALKLSLFLRDEEGRPVVIGPDRSFGRLSPISYSIPETDIDVALEKRPEMEVLNQKLVKAEVEVTFLRNQWAPELDVKMEYSKDIGSLPLDEPGEQGPDAPPGFPTTDRFQILNETVFKVGLALKAPLLLRKDGGKFREAQGKLSALQREVQFKREKLRNQLARLRFSILALQGRAVVAAENQRAAELAAQAERRRFEIGTTDLFQVFLRESVAGEAALKAIDAIAAQRAATTAWQFATCQASIVAGLPSC